MTCSAPTPPSKPPSCDSDAARQAAVTRMLDHYLHTAAAAAALLCPGRDLLRLDPPRAPG